MAILLMGACGSTSSPARPSPTPETPLPGDRVATPAVPDEPEEPDEPDELEEEVERLYGKFVRSELLTAEPEAAGKFYQQLLGWTITQDQKSADLTYIVTNHGREIARIRKHDPKSTIPAGWMSWISVEDIDDMLRDIPANGGTVLDKPRETDLGRSAVLQGPTDGVFGIVQLEGAADADLSARPGDFVLSQLWTDSFDVALGFYSVIGDYTTVSVTVGKDKYRIMQGDGTPRALIRLAPPGKANRWIPFVLNRDLDQLTKDAKKLKATIIIAPRSVPMLGRIAVLQAPTGGIIGFITPLDSDVEATD